MAQYRRLPVDFLAGAHVIAERAVLLADPQGVMFISVVRSADAGPRSI
jgi:hypothetical protein